MIMNRGRLMLPGPTDGAAERRVPSERLHLIPEAARPSFVPWVGDLPGLKLGENDLTRIAPGRPQAEGEVLEISGRVLDEFGRPVRHTLVEIWNANRWGRYTHVKDPVRERLDPNFLGFGRTMTDEAGRYRFRTIRPGSYLARPDIDRWRPAHVHVSIRGGSARLIAQMYFEGDPHLVRDPMFILLGAAQDRHFGKPVGRGPNDEALYHWDIVIGGRNTVYFES
ncbi:protocatechuate 3,4-dioxygenase subunit beta [Bosea sp. ASV33]|uniref:dioxygenase family protein n=1 Tax=Bosea sp. ASV33 TaxID=2795106 RepID=UPI0018EA86F8|nr:protocatechuate 3,4-dioxygenase subunit beta [Bosea sp. ASV33]